jgi:putative thioredoxin
MHATHAISDFQTDVIERSRTVPVLVDFWAAWCAPCRMLGPTLEKLAGEAGGAWELAKVDTEQHEDLARRYGVSGIPNCKLFVDGEVVDEFTGALPEPQVRRWLEDALPSPATQALAEAEGLLAEGHFYEAAVRLRGIIESRPDSPRARLLLGVALLRLEPALVDGVVEPIGADSDYAGGADSLRTLAALARLADRDEDVPAGPAKAHVLSAARALRAGDWDGTLAAIVEGLRVARGEEAAALRDRGVAVFRLLGIRHPACETHYRAFSSLMNA